jgi:hypothetical protein
MPTLYGDSGQGGGHSINDEFDLPAEFLATLGLAPQDLAVNFDLWPAVAHTGAPSSALGGPTYHPGDGPSSLVDFDFASFDPAAGSFDGAM